MRTSPAASTRPLCAWTLRPRLLQGLRTSRFRLTTRPHRSVRTSCPNPPSEHSPLQDTFTTTTPPDRPSATSDPCHEIYGTNNTLGRSRLVRSSWRALTTPYDARIREGPATKDHGLAQLQHSRQTSTETAIGGTFPLHPFSLTPHLTIPLRQLDLDQIYKLNLVKIWQLNLVKC